MRTKQLIIGLILALTACGGSDRAATIEQVDPTEEAASSEELQAALLTIEDLPTGWTTAPPDASPSADPLDSDDGTKLCDKPVIDRTQAPASAEVEFSKGGELSNQLFQEVFSYDSRRKASDAFDSIREAIQACTQWETSDESTTSSLTLQSLSFPKLGDDTLAVRMGGEVKSKPDESEELSFDLTAAVAGDVVIIRENNLLTLVGQIGLGIFGPVSVDTKETETIARKALERLENV
jgi:hypothetical protein